MFLVKLIAAGVLRLGITSAWRDVDLGSDLQVEGESEIDDLRAEVSCLRKAVKQSGVALDICATDSAGSSAGAAAAGSSEEATCCCGRGSCEVNEQGIDGSRSVEVHDPERCCKQLPSSGSCGAPWDAKVSQGDCTSSERKLLDALLQSAVPEKGRTAQDCRDQLKAAFEGIGEWASGISLHGHWIHSIHSLQLGEVISYQLFVSGMAFGTGSLAAGLFDMNRTTKLLWSGVAPDVRRQWKQKMNAGELSEDTLLGKILRQKLNGTLFDACTFATVLTFWQTASTSLLNTGNQRPVLLLINKDEPGLEFSIFWNAELPALALNPPPTEIRIVTFSMSCLTLLKKLTARIQQVAGNIKAAELRWFGVTGLQCKQPKDQEFRSWFCFAF